MKLIALCVIFVFPILCSSQNTNVVEIKKQGDVIANDFSEASDFFFLTLQENFGKTDGENLLQLMKIISKFGNKREDHYRLQVDFKEFSKLNSVLTPVYELI